MFMMQTGQRRFKGLCLALSLSLFSTMVSVPVSGITPNFKDTEITEFIDSVGKTLKKTIIVDPNVRGKINVRVYDDLNDQQFYQFFLNVLQVYGYAVVEMPTGILKVVRDKDAKTSNIPVVDGSPFGGDEMVTRVVPVYNVPVRELAPILRQLTNAAGGGNVVSHDPSNVMMITGRAATVNRLVSIIERVDQAGDEEIEIIKLEYASASEMVRIVESVEKSKTGKNATAGKSAPRIVADDRTNSILISGDVKARQRLINLIKRMDQDLESNGNTRVIYLKYAKATELVDVLKGVSASIQAEAQGGNAQSRRSSSNSRDINIDAHESSNSLVITAEPDMMRSLEEVIRQLDVRRAQVQVEAIIVEIFEGDGTTLGVQWANRSGGGQQFTNGVVPIGGLGVAVQQAENQELNQTNVTANGEVVATTNTREGDFQPLANLLGGLNGFLVGAVDDDWSVVLQAVSNDTNSNVLATPHLTTMDNEEAVFVVGEEVPVITGSTTGNNNSNPFQTVDRQEVGIKLKVTPQVNEGTAVQLVIEQEVSSVSGATSVDITINTRELKTSVIVDDGGTIVLGGLIDEQVQESVSKVPLLGDIPFVGNLFKSTTSSKRKRNLMVFLRPTIVREGLLMNQISNRKYNYIRAEQLKRQQDGVPLMPFTDTPVLPEWNDALTLPPTYEDFLMEQQKKEENE